MLDTEGKPGKLDLTTAFEVTTHPKPEMIVPFPAGTVGVRSDELPLAGLTLPIFSAQSLDHVRSIPTRPPLCARSWR